VIVDIDSFLVRLTEKWRYYRNSTPSRALRNAWADFATLLNQQIEAPSSRWPVWIAPLGTSKTLGLKVYASMLPVGADAPGLLVIVKQREDADSFAAIVNQWAGAADVALSHHAKTEPVSVRRDLDGLARWPVLAITHGSYERGLETTAFDDDDAVYPKFDAVHQLRLGGRKERALVVADESLDMIFEDRITYTMLQTVRSATGYQVMKQNPEARRVLDAAEAILLADEPEGGHRALGTTDWGNLDLAKAEDALARLWEQRKLFAKKDEVTKQMVATTLAALRRSFTYYRWRYSSGTYSAVVGAKMLTPPTRGFMVLDATGRTNAIYAGRPDEFDMKGPREKVRSYQSSTFTLHVTREKNGKMADTKRVAQTSLSKMQAIYTKAGLLKRKILLVTAERHEEIVRDYWESAGFERAVIDEATGTLMSGNLAVTHWGATDGKCLWSDFDTLVVPTLLYADLATDIGQYWLDQREEPTTAKLRATPPGALKRIRCNRVLNALVQVGGRICIRRTVDDEGNTLPAELHAFAQKDVRQVDYNDIALGLAGELEDIKVVVDVESDEKPRGKGTTLYGALLDLVKGLPAGERLYQEGACKRLGISETSWERLVRAAKPGGALAPLLPLVGGALGFEEQRAKATSRRWAGKTPRGRGSARPYFTRSDD
jgi:hypothetical protein